MNILLDLAVVHAEHRIITLSDGKHHNQFKLIYLRKNLTTVREWHTDKSCEGGREVKENTVRTSGTRKHTENVKTEN
jgi:hypothetical protein